MHGPQNSEHIFTLARKTKCQSTKFKIVHTHLLPTDCCKKKEEEEKDGGNSHSKCLWVFPIVWVICTLSIMIERLSEQKLTSAGGLSWCNNFLLSKYINNHISKCLN